MPQIVVENLSKTFRIVRRRPGLRGAFASLFRREYREIRALDDVSFSIDRSELVAYIGPNGAGKSTTVKVLSGILVPTAGRCTVEGRTPWRERVEHVQNIGVVFGQRTQLWWDLPVIESFELLRDIYRVPPETYTRMRNDLADRLDLGPLLDVPVRQLSLGQRMRCDLAAALLHRPSILFLDEPTIGLDAASKLAIRAFIKEINRDHGVTVILTTHDMDDIEALCRRVLVIADGRVLCDGTLDSLRRRVTNERHLIVDLEEGFEWMPNDDCGRVIERDGGRLRLAFDPETISAADLIARITARNSVRDLFVENPPIERIIAKLYTSTAQNSTKRSAPLQPAQTPPEARHPRCAG